jgi:hypothetical protein
VGHLAAAALQSWSSGVHLYGEQQQFSSRGSSKGRERGNTSTRAANKNRLEVKAMKAAGNVGMLACSLWQNFRVLAVRTIPATSAEPGSCIVCPWPCAARQTSFKAQESCLCVAIGCFEPCTGCSAVRG